MTQVASFVVGETGSIKDLEHALWEVRYTVLLQLRHWKHRALDVWTVEPAEPAALEAERVFNRLTDGPAGFQG